MHAHVVTVDITDSDVARRASRSSSHREGGARDSWPATGSGSTTGHGTSVVVFETEEQARAAAPPADGGIAASP